MRPALGACNGVHLVHDHRLDPAQRLARLRGQQQEERLRSRDQDVRRLAHHRSALLLRRVPGADADPELRAQAGERPAQVALDVVVERLQRRDVEQAQALARARVEPVDPVEEGRQRLARAGRRLDQRRALRVAIAGQPSSCAGVGPSNACSNQARVAGLKTSSGLISARVAPERAFVCDGTVTSFHRWPTCVSCSRPASTTRACPERWRCRVRRKRRGRGGRLGRHGRLADGEGLDLPRRLDHEADHRGGGDDPGGRGTDPARRADRRVAARAREPVTWSAAPTRRSTTSWPPSARSRARPADLPRGIRVSV